MTLKIAQARLAAPTIDQFASAYMLERIQDDYLENTRKEFQSRRDTLYNSLKAIPDVAVLKPKRRVLHCCSPSGEQRRGFRRIYAGGLLL